MIEIAIAIALLLALYRSVRARYVPGIVSGSAIAYLLLADTAAALAVPRAALPPLYPFAILLLGPGATPVRAKASIPLFECMLDHPSTVRAACALTAIAVVVVASRETAKLRPESARAYALDGLSFPFVLVAVLESIVAATELLVHALARGT